MKEIFTQNDVTGALYDFAAFLTTREKSIPVGAKENAGPIAELVSQFIKDRNFDKPINSNVQSWDK